MWGIVKFPNREQQHVNNTVHKYSMQEESMTLLVRRIPQAARRATSVKVIAQWVDDSSRSVTIRLIGCVSALSRRETTQDRGATDIFQPLQV